MPPPPRSLFSLFPPSFPPVRPSSLPQTSPLPACSAPAFLRLRKPAEAAGRGRARSTCKGPQSKPDAARRERASCSAKAQRADSSRREPGTKRAGQRAEPRREKGEGEKGEGEREKERGRGEKPLPAHREQGSRGQRDDNRVVVTSILFMVLRGTTRTRSVCYTPKL